MTEAEVIEEAEKRAIDRIGEQAVKVAEACTAHNRDLVHLGAYGTQPRGSIPLACIRRTVESGQRLAAAIELLAQQVAALDVLRAGVDDDIIE